MAPTLNFPFLSLVDFCFPIGSEEGIETASRLSYLASERNPLLTKDSPFVGEEQGNCEVVKFRLIFVFREPEWQNHSH